MGTTWRQSTQSPSTLQRPLTCGTRARDGPTELQHCKACNACSCICHGLDFCSQAQQRMGAASLPLAVCESSRSTAAHFSCSLRAAIAPSMLARWPFGGGWRCRCWRSAPGPSSWGAAPAWFALLGPAPAASCKRQSTLVQQAAGTACCLAGCRGTAGPRARHLMQEAVHTHVTARIVGTPEGGK